MSVFQGKDSFTPLEVASPRSSGLAPEARARLLTGFTLIELLIVTTLLAVLGAVVVVVLNPAEMFRQSRDSQRLVDLNQLNKVLSFIQVDQPALNFGSSSVVYVSIPDASSTCANLGLPTLPSGWSYACSNSTNYKKINGLGWVPVDFTLFSAGSPISKLPIDPVNATSTGEYYTYTAGGSWHLTAFLTSDKYKMGGSTDKSSKDGGSYPELFEIGNNLSLLPVNRDSSLVGYWKFDEGSGTTVYDASGHNATGTWSGTGSHWVTGVVGSYAAQFNGTNDYMNIPDSSDIRLNGPFSISFWERQVSFVNTYPGFMIKGNAVTDGYLIFYMSNGYITYKRNNDNRTPGAVVSSVFKHVAITYDNANLRFYVDGLLAYSVGPIAYPTNSGTGVLNFRKGDEYGNEIMDDVRIYNRTLSAAEIQAIYNATK